MYVECKSPATLSPPRASHRDQRPSRKCISPVVCELSASGPQLALGSGSALSARTRPVDGEVGVMAKRKIIITRSDYEYLKELLSSEFTQAISPSDYLESLKAELELAEVVDPERVPKNV